MNSKSLVILRNFVFFLIIGLMISGCATEYTTDQPKAMKSSAQLSFFRPNTIQGKVVSVPVYVNGIKIGNLGDGGTLAWSVKPGTVTVGTSPGTATIVYSQKYQSSITMKVESGKSYRFKIWLPYQFRLVGKPLGGEIAARIALIN